MNIDYLETSYHKQLIKLLIFNTRSLVAFLLTCYAIFAVAEPNPPMDVAAPSSNVATTPEPTIAPKDTPKPKDLIPQLPNFKNIQAASLASNVLSGFEKCDEVISAALQQPISWDNTLQPILDQLAIIKSSWNLLIILNNVDQSGETRNSLNDLAPKMSDFHRKVMRNPELYKAMLNIQDSSDFVKLTTTQQVFINQTLLDYKLYGAELTATQQQEYAEIITNLRAAAEKYTSNLNNATDSWQYYVAPQDVRTIEGLPEFIVKDAAALAKENNKNGWLFDLSRNNLVAVETFAKDRKLRETFYKAFATLASKEDPDANRQQWDNTPLVAETIKLRSKLATLLGYPNFAAYAIADRSPPDAAQALQFLVDLASKLKPLAEQEFAQLLSFAKMDKEKIQPWDVAYYAQWEKGTIAADSQNQSREYLQIDNVIQGLLNLTSILFNVNAVVVEDASTWDPSVKLYKLTDVQNNIIGYFYLDLYTRTNKSPTDKTLIYTPRLHPGTNTVPVAVMCTNLRDNELKLITHGDLLHIFAQFGDVLQRLMATMDYAMLSNSNGMHWDAIAQASQFMQNWAWQKQFIQDISKHYKTGEKIPDALFDTLKKANDFDKAINLLQQIQLAIFDLRIHLNLTTDEGKSALAIYKEITSEFEVLPTIKTDNLPNRFTETFTSNIAATYYCYYWDKSIAADAFAYFMENDAFSAKIGHKYRDTLLEQGGQASLLDLFTKFRGRPPVVNTPTL